MNITVFILYLIYGITNYSLEKKQKEDCISEQEDKRTIDKMKKKEIDDLKSANENKDLVLATVTHDLKTPVFTIGTQIKLALESKDLKQIHHHLGIAEKNISMH